MKMRERAVRRKAHEEIAQRCDFIPRHAGAVHSGVDRQMPRPASFFPAHDALVRAERWSEIGANRRVEVAGEERSEDENGPGDACAAKFLALSDGRNTEAPRVEPLERA